MGQRMVLLRPDPALLAGRFLLYALLSGEVRSQIDIHMGAGSIVSNLRVPTILDLKVPVPPLHEQRRIAAVLGALDDKVELNRWKHRALEGMAQALFTSWFIDFDGVPREDLVDSELGPIPKGWEITSLQEHITLDKGLSYKGKFLTDSGVPMVNLKCVKPHGGFRRDATKPYSGDFKPRHQVRPGDVIIANTDLTQARDILGCPAFVPQMVGATAIITSHHTFAVRFAEGSRIKRHFLYHFLLSPLVRRRCRGFATGTTVLAVPRDAVLDVQFPLPPAERLMEFEHLAQLLRGRIEASEDESETLSRARDILLPKLISGEIRVPESNEDPRGA